MGMVRSDGRNHSLLLYVAILVVVCFVSIVELEAKSVDGTLEGSEFVLKEWGDSCASLTEAGCIACTSSSLCHWCGKLGACHVLGSPYGCLWGTSCLAPSECMRKEPEFIGYAKPSWEVVLAISIVMILLLMCSSMVAILVAGLRAKTSKAEETALDLREMEGMGYKLLECSVDGHGSEVQPEYSPDCPSIDSTTNNLIESSSSTQPNNEALTTPLISNDGVSPRDSPHSFVNEGAVVDLESTAQHSTPKQHNTRWLLWRVPSGEVMENNKVPQEGIILLYERSYEFLTLFSRTPGPSHSWLLVYNGMKLLCGFFMIAVVMGGIFIAFYVPHRPSLNICSTKFEWESIVHSMENLEVEADFEILASMYNPNRFDLRVSSGTGVFRHENREVGQITMYDTVYNSGYVTDILVTTLFDTEAWEGLKLGYQYEMGQLSFLVDIHVHASVKLLGFYSWTFPVNLKDYYVPAANATQYDRHLCHCPTMV